MAKDLKKEERKKKKKTRSFLSYSIFVPVPSLVL